MMMTTTMVAVVTDTRMSMAATATRTLMNP